MKQPFHYADGRRAMPRDEVKTADGQAGSVLALWFDSTDNTDATVVLRRSADMKRVNLAECERVGE